MTVYLTICVLIFVWTKMTQPSECSIRQAVFRTVVHKRMINHVIETANVRDERECGLFCIRHNSCTSANYQTSGNGKGLCQLISKPRQEMSKTDEESNPEFNYIYIIRKTLAEQVILKTDKGKRQYCTSNNDFSQSCKELKEKNRFLIDGVYKLRNNDSREEYSVYCHMSGINGCGQGGWTLVMKLDGNKTQFKYSSFYWTNKVSYAVEDGLKGLIEKQSKLASYWNTPFSKLCVGMKVNETTNWIVINHESTSLFDTITGGSSTTQVSKNTWKSLISSAMLQPNCNQQGFNLEKKNRYDKDGYMNVRIGFVANNQNDCASCDSCIGFGISVQGCEGDIRKTTCGNIAICGKLDEIDTATFGYIFVQ